MKASVIVPSTSLSMCPQCGVTHSKGERFCIIDGCELVPKAFQPSPVVTSPQLGRVVAGRCELLRSLGKGGMGEVFLGFHRTLMCDVAVKLLLGQQRNDLTVKRFLREAMAVARLEHDSIVRILDFGMDGGEPYLIMELLRGVSLRQHLANTEQGRLPLNDAMEILAQLLEALDHAHCNNVVHRDIKLENLMLVENDESRCLVKLLDFGIARLLDLVPDTPILDLLGTPEYMAPELWQSSSEVSPAVDLYACGVLAYELLVGALPFPVPEGSTSIVAHFLFAHAHTDPLPLRSLRPEIPERLELLVKALLRKQRTQRPTAREANLQLRAILEERAPRPQRHLLVAADEDIDPALAVAATQIIAPAHGGETAPMLSRVNTTIIAPFRLRQIEELDSAIDVLYGRIQERVEEVVAAAPSRWPASFNKLRESMKGLEEEEDALGEQLAILSSRARENQQAVALRQRLLRQEMIELAEHRNLCVNPQRLSELTRSLDQKNREFAATAAELDGDLLEVIERTRHLRQQQKDAARRLQVSLVYALVANTAPPHLVAAFRELRQLVAALDARLSELFVNLQGLRKKRE